MGYFSDFDNLNFIFYEVDNPVIAYPDSPKVFFFTLKFFAAFWPGIFG